MLSSETAASSSPLCPLMSLRRSPLQSPAPATITYLHPNAAVPSYLRALAHLFPLPQCPSSVISAQVHPRPPAHPDGSWPCLHQLIASQHLNELKALSVLHSFALVNIGFVCSHLFICFFNECLPSTIQVPVCAQPALLPLSPSRGGQPLGGGPRGPPCSC